MIWLSRELRRFSFVVLWALVLSIPQASAAVPGGDPNHPASKIANPSPALLTPGNTFSDCQAGCPEMVVVPNGQFLMGSGRYAREQPEHIVTIPTKFALGRFDVTFADWAACAEDGGCSSNSSPSDQGWGRGNRPVINVSWVEANEYVEWLSKKTGREYRLPTEAEWEYADRAGSTKDFPWGDAIDCGRARYDGGPGSRCGKTAAGWVGTRPVGQYPPNAWGLYDMQGNVWQWCYDSWHQDYRDAPADGSAWHGGDETMAVIRGGAWNYAASGLRSADRNWLSRSARTSFLGFRVARSLDDNVAMLSR